MWRKGGVVRNAECAGMKEKVGVGMEGLGDRDAALLLSPRDSEEDTP